MSSYAPPLRDMAFVMQEMGLLDAVATLPGYEESTDELVDAVLEEAGRLAAEVLAPLNHSGDRQGVRFENGVVRAADGFAEAYRAFVEGGWNTLPFACEIGGQGLPWLVATAVQEMWNSANMSWALCPLLTQSAVEVLAQYGSDEQKRTYLPKLVTGEWAGTMNLTEPQAGSDLGAIACRAERDGAHYRLKGQKIFITWGEHDMTENIVHMVLARSPDGPPGTQGLSLYLVPKVLVNADGSLGPRNDLRCVSVERKLGIHASPTCVMSYGDHEGAVAYLVGRENQGLRAMFTMMNLARVNVGLEGLAIAERAYQQARAYARERVQGRSDEGGAARVAIIHHPDVRRMLTTMKAQIEAMRAVVYDAAATLDRAKREPDEAARRAAEARFQLLTPIVKAWCSDLGVEVASTAIQVHGGIGYIEETGVAQHYRDARIATIYEGTNGIQARDLVGRKVLRDGGAAASAYIAELRRTLAALEGRDGPEFAAFRRTLPPAIDALERATDWLLATGAESTARAFAGATPYLRLFGTVAGGAMMARAAQAAAAARGAGTGDVAFLDAKLATARFYAEHLLPLAPALLPSIIEGSDSVFALAEDQF